MEEEKKFVCVKCGSKSTGTAGTCCGAEREEKKNDEHANHKHTCSNC